MIYNFAIVAPKNSKAMSNDGFFRDYTNSRDVNFSSGLPSIMINHYPISSDQYTVLKRIKRRVRGANTDTTNVLASTSQFGGDIIDMDLPFFRCHRQVRFNDDTTTTCENPIFMIHWCDFIQAGGGDGVTEQAMFVQLDAVTCFKDQHTR